MTASDETTLGNNWNLEAERNQCIFKRFIQPRTSRAPLRWHVHTDDPQVSGSDLKLWQYTSGN